MNRHTSTLLDHRQMTTPVEINKEQSRQPLDLSPMGAAKRVVNFLKWETKKVVTFVPLNQTQFYNATTSTALCGCLNVARIQNL